MTQERQSEVNLLEELSRSLSALSAQQEQQQLAQLLADDTPLRLGYYPSGAEVAAAGTSSPGTTVAIANGAVGTAQLAPGAVNWTKLDHTAPSSPTGLTMTSDVSRSSSGADVVRLVATITQPSDDDLFASWVEVTKDWNQDDASPAPLWTNPAKLFIPAGSTSASIEGVMGATAYWARAYSVDVNQNSSSYTSVYGPFITIGDTTPPAIPTNLVAVGGYKGAGLTWQATNDADVASYAYQYSSDGGTTWSQVYNVKATTAWIPGLTAGVAYTFRVESIDLSGNESGWSATASATPNSIGSSDFAADTVIARILATGKISADDISAGRLVLRPSSGLDAIEIRDASNVLLGEWSASTGITLYGSAGESAVFSGARLDFYTEPGGQSMASIGPEGIVADSIRSGSLQGGQNLVKNSSFELSTLGAGTSSAVFTDSTGTPGWKAAYRVTSPDNVTEATTLTATVAF